VSRVAAVAERAGRARGTAARDAAVRARQSHRAHLAARVVVIEQARRILLAAAELGEIARQAADPFRGTLRLGVIPTIGPYLLPDLTPALAKRFPRLSIAWTEARTQDLVRELREGSLDAVLLALEADIGDLDHVVVMKDPFVLAASTGHPS